MTTDRELINRLLTLAGMIMEDASAVAIIDDGEEALQARVTQVRSAGQSVVTLADAADVVLRLGTSAT